MRRAAGLKISAARIKRGISAGLLEGSMGAPNAYRSKRKPIKGNRTRSWFCRPRSPSPLARESGGF